MQVNEEVFKVGDVVRMSNPYLEGPNYGGVGIITRVYGGMTYDVYFQSTDSYIRVMRDEIRHSLPENFQGTGLTLSDTMLLAREVDCSLIKSVMVIILLAALLLAMFKS